MTEIWFYNRALINEIVKSYNHKQHSNIVKFIDLESFVIFLYLYYNLKSTAFASTQIILLFGKNWITVRPVWGVEMISHFKPNI